RRISACSSTSKSASRSTPRASKRCWSCAATRRKSKTERDEGLAVIFHHGLRAAAVSDDAAAARAARAVRARPRARALRLSRSQPSDGRRGRRNVSPRIFGRRILEQRARPQRFRAVARFHHRLSKLAGDLGAQPAAQRVGRFPCLVGKSGLAYAIMGDVPNDGALRYRQPTLYTYRRDHGGRTGAGAFLGAEARTELSRAD